MASQPRLQADQEASKPQENTFWDVDLEEILHPSRTPGVYELKLASFFNAAHQVSMQESQGPLHRHSYHLRVTARAEELSDGEHVVVPYEALRSLIDLIAQSYEGTILNELPPFEQLHPTTENLVGVIAHQLIKLSEGLPIEIVEVTVMESPTQGVSFRFHAGDRVNGWNSANGSGGS